MSARKIKLLLAGTVTPSRKSQAPPRSVRRMGQAGEENPPPAPPPPGRIVTI